MLHTLDILILCAFIAQAIVTGFWNRKVASQNLEEYFLAGRSLPGWKAGISMAATQFAADTPLLVTGLIATAGIFSLWRLWIYALAFLLMGFLLARSWRRVEVLTDAELTEIRYGQTPALVLRMLKAIYFGTIVNCVVMAMVLLAATRVAEPFLLWHEFWPASLYQPILAQVTALGVPITASVASPDVWIHSTNNLISLLLIVSVTTLYSSSGGLRSVVSTDVLQFFIMMIATIAYAGYVVYESGGMQNLLLQVREIYGSSSAPISADQLLAFTPSQAANIGYTVFAVLALQWLVQMNSDGTGYLAQRTMACRTEKDAKVAAIVFTFAQILFRSLFWLPIGLGLIVLFPPNDFTGGYISLREASFVRGMAEILPVGIKGLMLTGMLAALASTIDTHLNWGASYWSNDLYKRLFCEIVLKKKANPKSLVWVARIANIFLLLIALVIMFNLQNIQMAWQASLILGAGMGVPLLLRWLWWRMNAWGEIAAIFASTILAPVLLLGFPELHEATKLLINASVSLCACLSAIFLFGPESQQTLAQFYRRASPLGFWGAMAKNSSQISAHSSLQELRNSLLAMFACALSLFCFLVGIGTWLVGAPVPTWWLAPASFWIALNLFLGIALTPVWYYFGFIGLRVR